MGKCLRCCPLILTHVMEQEQLRGLSYIFHLRLDSKYSLQFFLFSSKFHLIISYNFKVLETVSYVIHIVIISTPYHHGWDNDNPENNIIIKHECKLHDFTTFIKCQNLTNPGLYNGISGLVLKVNQNFSLYLQQVMQTYIMAKEIIGLCPVQ